jgi:calpain-15
MLKPVFCSFPAAPLTTDCFNDITDYNFSESFVRQVIKEGQPYTDMNFLPTRKSLLCPENKNNGISDEQAELYLTLKWWRASEMREFPILWSLNIKPENIKQGSIGNCYFITAISSLASLPNILEDVFITKETNEAGIYAMRFFLNGLPRIVVVDDYLPVRADGSQAFAKSTYSDECWISLLEKAWAKLHGSYCMIDNGRIDLVFSALTNRPTYLFTHKTKDFSPELLWQKLKTASRMRMLMASYTPV